MVLKTLLKKQLLEIFRSYVYDSKKNKSRSKGATIGYFIMYAIIMVGVLGGLFTYMALSMCSPLAEAGMGWLYFAIFTLIAIVLGAFGSVFNTYSSLYMAKDNDLLLSMPIPVGAILVSRLLAVYLMGLMYSAVVFIPAAIVYWVMGSCSLSVVVCSVVMMVMISIFVLVLSCALGWVVAKVSQKLKNKSFITVIISLAFIGLYYFFYFKAQSVINDLITNAVEYGAKIKASAYPMYLIGLTPTGDWLATAVVSLVVLALFGLTWRLLSRSFIGIVTSNSDSGRVKYKAEKAKKQSPDMALLKKELGRFTSSANYMLNCGMGTLFLLIMAVALVIKGSSLVSTLDSLFEGSSDICSVLLVTALSAMISMNDITAPSISLEGKSIWLLQSLPVRPWQALRAKLGVQLLVTMIPVLICSLCGVLVLKDSIPARLLAVGLSLLFVLFSGLLGLVLNLKMPNLTWTSEIGPIKQSAPVAINLFSGWVYAIALMGIYMAVGYKLGAAVYLLIFIGLTLAADIVMYLWLKKEGCRLFMDL